MTITFDLLKFSDLDVILPLIQNLYEHDKIHFVEHIARSSIENLIRDESKGRVWLIGFKGVVVGYCVLTFGYSLEFHGRDALMDELYIKEEFRGKGLGQEAIKFIEWFCRELNVAALHLHVGRSNKSAHALYEKVGFKEHDRNIMTKWIDPK